MSRQAKICCLITFTFFALLIPILINAKISKFFPLNK